MPSYDPLFFNIDPYYNDFDENKKYLKLLFRPGFALQARELSQIQSILQNQIERFGNFIFNDGSMVYGGQITEIPVFVSGISGFQPININQITDSVVEFKDEFDNSSFAKIFFSQKIEQKDYIYYSFISGNALTGSGTTIEGSLGGLSFSGQLEDFEDEALVILVDEGIRYTNGYFVYHEKQKIGLYEKNESEEIVFKNPTRSVGFEVKKDIVTSEKDPSLLDPSFGSFNYNAPGADRFKIDLVLTQKELEPSELKTASTSPLSRTDFIEIIRTVEGETVKKEKYAELGSIEETFARRTYDESGHYIVDPFDLTFATGPSESTLTAKLESGKAYIFGYEFETQGNSFLTHDKARETSSLNEVPFGYGIGSYVLVNFSGISGGLSGFEMISSNQNKLPKIIFDSYSGTQASVEPVYGLRFEIDGVLDLNRFTPGITVYFDGNSDFSSLSANTTTRGIIKNIQIISDVLDENNSFFFTKMEVENFSNGTPQEILSLSPFYINTFTGGSWGTSLTASNASILNLSPSSSLTGGPLSNDIGSARVFNIQRQSGNTYKLFLEGIELNSQFTISDFKRVFFDGTTGNPSFYAHESSPKLYSNQRNSRLFPTRSKEVVKFFTNFDFIIDFHYENLSLESGKVTITKESFAEQIGPNVSCNESPISISNCSFITLYDDLGEVDGTYTLKCPGVENSNPDRVEITPSRSIVGNLKAVVSQRVLLDSESSEKTIRTKSERTVVASLTGPSSKEKYFLHEGKLLTDVFKINNIPIHNPKSYVLETGQRDTYYDFSKIILTPFPEDLNLNGLTASVSYFEHDGEGPFVLAEGESSYENYENIPAFYRNNGEEVSLRSSVDFRPTRIGSLDEFSFSGPYSIPSAIFGGYDHSSSYTYYIPRIDKIILSRNKTFNVLKGFSSQFPTPPPDDSDSMTLYTIVFNPYTFDENDVTISQEDNRRFTMKDIGTLEKRVESIEKYTTLSIFEQEAKNTPIYDEFGLEIPKKAILTDQFQDGGNGDILNSDFLCSVDKETGELTPHQVVTSMDMNAALNNLTSLTSSDGIIHPFISAEEAIIENKFGNNFRQINSNEIVDFLGSLKMNQQFDKWFDDSSQPIVKNNSNGVNNSWLLADKSFKVNSKYWDHVWFGKERNPIEKEFQKVLPNKNSYQLEPNSIKKLNSFTNPLSSIRNVSEKIIDKSIVPYCRQRNTNLTVSAEFLKPETNHFVFFDGELLTTDGVGITTDEFGRMEYQFNIPSGKFPTGKKLLRISDVENYDQLEKSSSSGDIVYYAGGTTKDTESQNYLRPLIHRRESSNTENITNDPLMRDFQRITKKSKNSKDTLSQIFTVDSETYKSGLFITSIDLYFDKYPISNQVSGVDYNLPVRVQIRPTVNGYPSPSRIVAESILYNDEIANSANETLINSENIQAKLVKFEFDYPVYLVPGEYAICVESNSDTHSIVTYVLPSTSNNTLDQDKTNFVNPMLGNLFLPKNTGKYEKITNEFISLNINRAVFQTPPNTSFDLTNTSALTNNTNLVRSSVEGIFPSGTNLVLKIGNRNYSINKTIDITDVSGGGNWEIDLSGNSVVAPLVDTKASSIVYSKYSTNSLEDISKESSPRLLDSSGVGSRYVSKTLTLLNPANNLRVVFEKFQPQGTRIEVFGRYLTEGSNESLESVPYRRMFVVPTTAESSGGRDSFSTSEYTFRGFVPKFSSFNIKIVFYSSSKKYPKIKNLKVIAI